MNVADSQRVSSALEKLGYEHTPKIENADVIVLNTCVVRQSAEDKAVGRLSSLRPLKKNHPSLVINLMGCMVGIKDNSRLKERFPYVDVFSAPSDPLPLINYLANQQESRELENEETTRRFAHMDGTLILPLHMQGTLVATHIPVVYGCSHACTYCIIPYQRGGEISRPAHEILAEARSLGSQGVKEITLLGQIVDRYGKDQPEFPSLASLLRQMHEIDTIERLRFLTSHPNWMTDELLETVRDYPKVMPHIEVPAQSGDNTVLENMQRGYTREQYIELVEHIRERIPGVSIATDIIVGFPGETEAQFQNTYNMLSELKMDVAHLARYSPREGTVSARRMPNDVSELEKWSRFRQLEILQERIVAEIHSGYLSKSTPVLFEEKIKNRWKGRTPTNKLVFVETEENLRGQVKDVIVRWTGPWSMIADLA